MPYVETDTQVSLDQKTVQIIWNIFKCYLDDLS